MVFLSHLMRVFMHRLSVWHFPARHINIAEIGHIYANENKRNDRNNHRNDI